MKISDEIRKANNKDSEAVASVPFDEDAFRKNRATKIEQESLEDMTYKKNVYIDEDGNIKDSTTKELIPPAYFYGEDGEEACFEHPTKEEIAGSQFANQYAELFTNEYYDNYNLTDYRNWLKVKICLNTEYGYSPIESRYIDKLIPYFGTVKREIKLNDGAYQEISVRTAMTKEVRIAIAPNMKSSIPIILPMFLVAQIVRHGYVFKGNKTRHGIEHQEKAQGSFTGDDKATLGSIKQRPIAPSLIHERKLSSVHSKGNYEGRPFYSVSMCYGKNNTRVLSCQDFVAYDGNPARLLSMEELEGTIVTCVHKDKILKLMK